MYYIYLIGGGKIWYYISDLTIGGHPAMATLFLTKEHAERKARVLTAQRGYLYQVGVQC